MRQHQRTLQQRSVITACCPHKRLLGRALYAHYGLEPENYEANILIEDRSIRVAEGLVTRGIWRCWGASCPSPSATACICQPILAMKKERT